ncbi:MAG: hypothetical protein P8075_03090 [Deltaproteobacteria bacterium]|jgi:hypothetical protein
MSRCDDFHDFYGFYDLNDFNDWNGFNDLPYFAAKGSPETPRFLGSPIF